MHYLEWWCGCPYGVGGMPSMPRAERSQGCLGRHGAHVQGGAESKGHRTGAQALSSPGWRWLQEGPAETVNMLGLRRVLSLKIFRK